MTEIIRELRNGVALITLNRPAALNALSLEMISNLTTVLRACVDDKDVRAVLIKGAGGKAFCAGGDIRALYQSFRAGDTLHRDFFSVEYTLDYFLRFYPKPYMALMDGITLGGGMGIAQGSPLRIVGDRTRAAMPEVGIGFFPDVGASFFLARAPGEVGVYLGLTGAQILAADCLYANLADAYLPKDSMERLQGMLTQIRWSADPATDLKRVIESLAAKAPLAAPLETVRPAIDQHFAQATVTAIVESLKAERRPEFADWARQTAATIMTRSPTMLSVTLRQLRLGRTLSFADCLRMEIGMALHSMEHGDFIEGVRALIIDKDNAPKWRPDSLAQVTGETVDRFFENRWAAAAHPLAQMTEDAAAPWN